MNDYTFKTHIDWMTITGKFPKSVERHGITESSTAYVNAVSIMRTILPMVEWHAINRGGGRFYDWFFDDVQRGIRVDISSRMSQGWMVQLRGTFWSMDDSLADAILESATRHGCQITRLDVAVDVFNTDIKPRDIFEDLRPGRGETSRRKLDFITSSTGETLAIGSRESRFYCRIYDKGAEQGTVSQWLRCELEIKQDAAHVLLSKSCAQIKNSAAAKMLDMIEPHESDVSEALAAIAEGANPARSHSRPEKSATERWLMETVLPSMRKLSKEDRGAFTRVMNAFEGLDFK